MHEGDLEISFVETIRDSDLSDSALELLDDVLGDSPVPILSTLWGFWKGARTVHNYFYVKKVVGFLTELGTMPKETRKAQVNKMLIVPGESKRFGEHIALLLDRMNDLEKARLMGRIATSFLQEKITIDELKSLNFALDQLDLRMLPTLRSIYSECFGSSDDPKLRPLANAGLLDTRLHVETDTLTLQTANLNGFSRESTRYESLKAASIVYERNDLGRLFVDTCFR